MDVVVWDFEKMPRRSAKTKEERVAVSVFFSCWRTQVDKQKATNKNKTKTAAGKLATKTIELWYLQMRATKQHEAAKRSVESKDDKRQRWRRWTRFY